MEREYKQYKVEVLDALNYTLNSSDNIEEYKHEYFQGKQSDERVYPISKHGIRVFEHHKEINSGVVSEVGGATKIHKNAFLIEKSNILICCCDQIYSLKIPELSINWRKRFDPSTCLGIYRFKGGYYSWRAFYFKD